jgi:hypothetical protein
MVLLIPVDLLLGTIPINSPMTKRQHDQDSTLPGFEPETLNFKSGNNKLNQGIKHAILSTNNHMSYTKINTKFTNLELLHCKESHRV